MPGTSSSSRAARSSSSSSCIYFGLPTIGITLPAFTASVLGFILCNAAYNSEYIRGAIMSIKDGQMTAAQALGMTKAQAIESIILPQAMRRAIPGLSNEFIYLIKYSSLAYMITVVEISGAAKTRCNQVFHVQRVLPRGGDRVSCPGHPDNVCRRPPGETVAIPGMSAEEQRIIFLKKG